MYFLFPYKNFKEAVDNSVDPRIIIYFWLMAAVLKKNPFRCYGEIVETDNVEINDKELTTAAFRINGVSHESGTIILQ